MVGHALADYPLQGDFLAKAKCPGGIAGIPWPIALFMHALIHGGAVMLATGSLAFGLFETAIHFLIDWLKCRGKTSFLVDQLLHVGCKLFYLYLLRFFPAHMSVFYWPH